MKIMTWFSFSLDSHTFVWVPGPRITAPFCQGLSNKKRERKKHRVNSDSMWRKYRSSRSFECYWKAYSLTLFHIFFLFTMLLTKIRLSTADATLTEQRAANSKWNKNNFFVLWEMNSGSFAWIVSAKARENDCTQVNPEYNKFSITWILYFAFRIRQNNWRS